MSRKSKEARTRDRPLMSQLASSEPHTLQTAPSHCLKDLPVWHTAAVSRVQYRKYPRWDSTHARDY